MKKKMINKHLEIQQNLTSFNPDLTHNFIYKYPKGNLIYKYFNIKKGILIGCCSQAIG